MPASPRPGRDPRFAAARAAGVTRIARLTGLDRTGVEVASAVRPRGHVLQVTNGKGERFEDAAAGAVMEAAELFAAERPSADCWGSAAALAARLGAARVVSPRALEPDRAEVGCDEVRIAWREGEDLLGGGRALVPAHAVHVPPAGAAGLGPALVRWTSNGMGAAADRGRALLHALLEAVERDRLARALPEGFTPGEVARRLLDRESVERYAPRAARLAARIEERGFRVFFLDVQLEASARPAASQWPDASASRKHTAARTTTSTGTPAATPTTTPTPASTRERARARLLLGSPSPSPLSLPCAAALLLDREGGPVPVAAGYACRLSRDGALHAALLEAAQSRATEVHGAREDVAFGDRRAAAPLADVLLAARPARSARALPDVRASPAGAAVRTVLARLRRAGYRRAVAVDLDGPAGVAVVKIVVPGLLLSELL